MDLTSADLTDANLAGADLKGAHLTRANLTGARLTRADLTSADLTGANLTRADVTGADVTAAGLPITVTLYVRAAQGVLSAQPWRLVDGLGTLTVEGATQALLIGMLIRRWRQRFGASTG